MFQKIPYRERLLGDALFLFGYKRRYASLLQSVVDFDDQQGQSHPKHFASLAYLASNRLKRRATRVERYTRALICSALTA